MVSFRPHGCLARTDTCRRRGGAIPACAIPIHGDPMSAKLDESHHLAILDEARDRDIVRTLGETILGKMKYAVGRDPSVARDHDWLVATALTVRDQIVDRWLDGQAGQAAQRKHVYYFSLEFLIGRLLFDAMGNLGLIEQTRAALAELGV